MAKETTRARHAKKESGLREEKNRRAAAKLSSEESVPRRQTRRAAQARRRIKKRLMQCACLLFALAMCAGAVALLHPTRSGRDKTADGRAESALSVESPTGTVSIPESEDPSFFSGTESPVSSETTAGAEEFVRATATPGEETGSFVEVDAPLVEETPEATEVPAGLMEAVPEDTESPAQEEDDGVVEIILTAAGDCTFGGDSKLGHTERFERYADKYGYGYYFQNVRELFEADDFTIVNLEGPLTTATSRRAGRTFNFRGDPANVQILTSSSVEICSFANNHALDYKQEGLEQTLEVLEEAGVGVSSYGRAYYAEKDGVRLCFLAFTEWDSGFSALEDSINVHRPSCDILVVSIHWGSEGRHSATDLQASWGKKLIDAGADLVLGHHSHVVGGIERYKGKYIVYSLGNFCFGGNKNPSDKNTMIFRQRFLFDPEEGLQDGGISILPCRISSDTDTNNYQPTLLSGSAARSVLQEVGKYSSLEGVIWEEEFEKMLAELGA